MRRLVRRVTLSQPLVDFYDRFSRSDSLGKRGEREAERFLLRQGMIIVARRYQDKFGEIDLIAVDGETIVFVEVKTRSSDHAGLPAEAVDQLTVPGTGTVYEDVVQSERRLATLGNESSKLIPIGESWRDCIGRRTG